MSPELPLRNNLFAGMEGKYLATQGDMVQLLDPVYNEPLEPWRPPRCVLEDSCTGQGISYLQQRGASLTVQLILAAHGSSGDFNKAVQLYPEIFSDPKIFGLEMDWRHVSGVHPLPCEIVLTSPSGRRNFQRAQLELLAQKSIILPCEYGETSGTPLANALLDMWGVYEEATSQEDTDPVRRNQVRFAATLAYQATRHWAIIGQLGYWLDLAGQTENLPPGQKVPLMLGCWHAPTVRRLREFTGVNVEVYDVPTGFDADYVNHGEDFMKYTTEGRATIEQLSAPLPY